MTENLRTVPQFAEENPAFSEQALRWHIFKAKNNGLADAGAIVRLGGRIYIDRVKFSLWVEGQQRVA